MFKFETLWGVPDLDQFVRRSPYSTPGRHAARLEALPDDLATLCAASRNVIGHYRAELLDRPVERHREIDSRWLEVILDIDQRRHPAGLDQVRALTDRVAGCCRDHSLLVVGALRQRGVTCSQTVSASPPTSRPVRQTTTWLSSTGSRAVGCGRTPNFSGPASPFNAHDMPKGSNAPFESAADAWLGWRAGDQVKSPRIDNRHDDQGGSR